VAMNTPHTSTCAARAEQSRRKDEDADATAMSEPTVDASSGGSVRSAVWVGDFSRLESTTWSWWPKTESNRSSRTDEPVAEIVPDSPPTLSPAARSLALRVVFRHRPTRSLFTDWRPPSGQPTSPLSPSVSGSRDSYSRTMRARLRLLRVSSHSVPTQRFLICPVQSVTMSCRAESSRH
jgi:hypothetical protein